MAVMFPANPALNDTVTDPATGAVWRWDGIKWTFAAGSGGGDGVTKEWVLDQIRPVEQAAMETIGRNYIDNARFNIWNRGDGPFNTTAWTTDRWRLQVWGSAAASITRNYPSDADRTAIGDEDAVNAATIGFTGSAVAGSAITLFQSIEGVRRLAAHKITVSFFAVTSAPVTIGVGLQQNFGSGGSPTVSVADTVAIPTGPFRRYEKTFDLPSAIGKTVGDNDYTSLHLRLTSTPSQTDIPGVPVQSATMRFWGIQVEIADKASPLENLDPAAERNRCLRYYQNLPFRFGAYGTAGMTAAFSSVFATSMRVTPTATPSGVTTTNCSALSFGYLGINGYQANTTVTAAAAFNVQGSILFSADLL